MAQPAVSTSGAASQTPPVRSRITTTRYRQGLAHAAAARRGNRRHYLTGALGAGGVLGAAWMTGALVRLHERLPAADVDLLVGTSAGSVLAAALRCRASLDEIVAWQAGDITGRLSESMVLAEQDGPLPPWPQLRPGSLSLARAALLLQVPPWVGASGWLPHGRGRHAALRSLIGALHERDPEDAGSWAD